MVKALFSRPCMKKRPEVIEAALASPGTATPTAHEQYAQWGTLRGELIAERYPNG